MQTEYKIDLDIYNGPLDLLLYLIRREEVDVYDIPIAKITDQYMMYLEKLQSIDIGLAGDFLVMASTLMYIKSQTLLPRNEVIDGEAALPIPISGLLHLRHQLLHCVVKVFEILYTSKSRP